MARRAVIYIRTSSALQGEKSSPVEQETDCRHLAQEKGLQVVHIYRDVERYRVGNKLVEPSGSRSDRPGLLAMLKDATRDEFDGILAWREDRLYRGLRSMLMVLETIQEYKIQILRSYSYKPVLKTTIKLYSSCGSNVSCLFVFKANSPALESRGVRHDRL